MAKFTYVVQDNEGIHARPAGMLVKEAKNFASECTITKDGKDRQECLQKKQKLLRELRLQSLETEKQLTLQD